MRIVYTKEGGLAYIPALAAPVTIDTGALEAEDAKAVESTVREAAFFELPARIGSPRPGAADYQTYTISVEDGGRKHTVQVTDLGERPEMAKL
ncbi:MAG: hypothetical protein FJX63_09740, partial [Alphaproteobacteria bacterium]|nr:hypothetical protein [Alphaproteobacteria bacterium]